MQKLGHTWPLFIFVRERVSTSQLALPCSSRQHKENKIQLGWALSCCLFWARVGCQGITPHHPAAILWREYEEDWFAWLFILLCSPEPEKIAGGNNSRRIQSLHNTIFQTLSVFESYVLFSLRKKEFPSVSAWETAWLPHLRQIFQSGSKQTVTMNRGDCYSSRVDWASPRNQLQHWAPLWLWQQGSCLENSFCSPVDSRPFLGLTSAEWSLWAYSFILFFFLFWLFLYFPKPIWCCGWVSFPVFRSVSPSTQSHVPLKPNANLSFAEMGCEFNAEGALSSWENRVVSRSVPECQVSVMHWDRDAQTLSASTGTLVYSIFLELTEPKTLRRSSDYRVLQKLGVSFRQKDGSWSWGSLGYGGHCTGGSHWGVHCGLPPRVSSPSPPNKHPTIPQQPPCSPQDHSHPCPPSPRPSLTGVCSPHR